MTTDEVVEILKTDAIETTDVNLQTTETIVRDDKNDFLTSEENFKSETETTPSEKETPSDVVETKNAPENTTPLRTTRSVYGYDHFGMIYNY